MEGALPEQPDFSQQEVTEMPDGGNAIIEDTDGDGYLESFSSDFDGDGVPESVQYAADGDGSLESLDFPDL